jgi:hypothetical protein
MTDRYASKPFLRLLDAYVLLAIGELDQESSDRLTAMEPKLRQTFNADGSWVDLVAQQMDFPPTLPDTIRDIWIKGREPFLKAYGTDPDPAEFTRQFVDTNFPTG